MASVLYAEIYLICIVIVGLCLFWTCRSSTHSASERWLRVTLTGFLVCFGANFLFTVFNSLLVIRPAAHFLSYFFKTVYHAGLCFGVYAWCGYADTEARGKLFHRKNTRLLTLVPLLAMVGMVVANLSTKKLFAIDEELRYVRGGQFQLEMGLLVLITALFSIRLLIQTWNETDPIRKSHQLLVASFPLGMLLAWAMTRFGEAVPVICVAITIELLCLFMGTSTQQISMDKLTQVNNRQNLLSFMDYKLVNHDEKLFLLMMDLDYFKTINDTYGHLEGDDALVRAANALKNACGSFKRRPYIARYGGDEFIVVVECSKPEAEELITLIREALEKTNQTDNKPYTLHFSIGVGEYHPGMDANALIESADNALYEIKRARPPRPR